jgi:very-short-patch-repair endonuclease/predicted transcriptional regulator of viral defense system
MGDQTLQSARSAELWLLAERQHWVVTRAQLLGLGFPPPAIKHRVAKGRLHPVSRGVYAVGRPQVTSHGKWIAAVLSCGPDAVLSHGSAAALWEIGAERPGQIEISVPQRVFRHRRGVALHRRAALGAQDVTNHNAIPVTTPICTLVDLAPRLGRRGLERAIKEADSRGLVDPETLRVALDDMRGRRGVAILRDTLDRRTFVLTDSELERRFLPIARRAGLPKPETQMMVNGFRVDFYWPELGLVVETDGLRYHRTPTQQAADRVRDQAHAAAGLTPLRFTHAQIAYEPGHVRETLGAVSGRLRTN